jgi:copper(I)-binding protein
MNCVKIALAVGLFAISSTAVMAAEYKHGEMTVSHPWARASAGNAKTGAAFLSVTNKGGADRLLAAESTVSKSVELHTHIKDGDVMMMRKVEAIDIPANGAVKLEPGGLHIMFINLNESLKEGANIPLILTFEKAGKLKVEAKIQGVGAMKGEAAHDMKGHSKH